MTIRDKSTLTALFENGDVPSGTNFADFIQSNVNLAETGIQSMAGSLYTTELTTARVSAGSANITGKISANTANIVSTVIDSLQVRAIASASSVSIDGRLVYKVTLVSAAGTTQGTATVVSASYMRLMGVTDGSATGIKIKTLDVGKVGYVFNSTTASANLWPPTDCTINALTTNAAFGMTANTTYQIHHWDTASKRLTVK